jgi:hypothetical protein
VCDTAGRACCLIYFAIYDRLPCVSVNFFSLFPLFEEYFLKMSWWSYGLERLADLQVDTNVSAKHSFHHSPEDGDFLRNFGV